MGNAEITPEFVEDLAGAIQMLSADKPLIGLLVALLENTLRRDAPGERIGQSPFARNHDRENAPLRVAETMHLRERRRQVGKMFQQVHGKNPVEMSSGET